MISLNTLFAVCAAYAVLLFVIAFVAERAAERGKPNAWLRAPIIYTLSLSIYCTAWTFYGAVGSAVRGGFEYLTIYLGPTLVLVGWWWGLRKLVHIGRAQKITSIADLISSRYGKSTFLGAGVTILAVIGTTPYIALQLQSVTLSFGVFAGQGDDPSQTQSALWVAMGLAGFTVLFGTRRLNANERHHGVVMAIAFEAVVKLAALLAVGLYVVWGLGGGVDQMLERINTSPIGEWQVAPGRWVWLTFLSAAAFVCLPRMFQVLVVENDNEDQLRRAAWAFPLYLMLVSLFVAPIAVMGLELLPAGSNPDLFVLTLPLSQGQIGLAVLSFLGGFSSATSMVIVAAIALSTMVSNHIVMPIWLKLAGKGASVSGDVRHVVGIARRVSIVAVVTLGYLYYRLSGGGAALSSIGLVSFTGVAQLLPALIGGLYWSGATRIGAFSGLTVGFGIWLFTHFLPSVGAGTLIPSEVFDHGVLGAAWLRPLALFGLEGLDKDLHALFWSLFLNGLTFVVASLLVRPEALDQVQARQFVDVYRQDGTFSKTNSASDPEKAEIEDLMVLAQRILGPNEARYFFETEARAQQVYPANPSAGSAFVQRLEREMAASVGAATAHAMMGQIVGGARVSVEDWVAMADETAQIVEYSAQLTEKSKELSRTAAELQRTNDKLTRLSVQKDAFLSQISHELRTPMTSIRAFSEILRDKDSDSEDRLRFAGIIHDETLRLTRLLDDLLDLSILENGQVNLNCRKGLLSEVLDRAVASSTVEQGGNGLCIYRDAAAEDCMLETDLDRLAQVFINLFVNARKYCDAPSPELRITVQASKDALILDFTDNGSGVPEDKRDVIFEKFSRVSELRAGGAGLGLAISRQILMRLGGRIEYIHLQTGACFRVSLPMSVQIAAQ